MAAVVKVTDKLSSFRSDVLNETSAPDFIGFQMTLVQRNTEIQLKRKSEKKKKKSKKNLKMLMKRPIILYDH